MDKNYKLFYSTGNNRYFTLDADGEIYLATETFIPTKAVLPIFKPKKLSQGLKLLHCTSPLLILFSSNMLRNPIEDADAPKELQKYEPLKPMEVTRNIRLAYINALDEQLKSLDFWYKAEQSRLKEDLPTFVEDTKNLKKEYNRRKSSITKNNPLNSFAHLEWKTDDKIARVLMREFNFLYTQDITPSMQNAYVYSADNFGTLTIYQMILVRGVVKTINTFIYDINLLKAFFESIYKKDVKVRKEKKND